MNNNKKIVVLIDGDNASSKNILVIFENLKTYGDIIIKKVYGDFSLPNLQTWKRIANQFAIKTMHGYNYTKGKNATDINLIIDAMDIIHDVEFDTLCIISSDCDFTGLINRAKENGIFTIGVGKKNSCISYKEACDKFIEEEKIVISPRPTENPPAVNKQPKCPNEVKVAAPKLKGLTILRKIDLNCMAK